MDDMGNIETLQPETLAFFGKRHLPLLEPNSCLSRPDPFEAGAVPRKGKYGSSLKRLNIAN